MKILYMYIPDSVRKTLIRPGILVRTAETINWRKQITINPDQCSGRPCIRGMRIRVVDVLDLLAAGLSYEQILEELPDLERSDIEASI